MIFPQLFLLLMLLQSMLLLCIFIILFFLSHSKSSDLLISLYSLPLCISIIWFCLFYVKVSIIQLSNYTYVCICGYISCASTINRCEYRWLWINAMCAWGFLEIPMKAMWDRDGKAFKGFLMEAEIGLHVKDLVRLRRDFLGLVWSLEVDDWQFEEGVQMCLFFRCSKSLD